MSNKPSPKRTIKDMVFSSSLYSSSLKIRTPKRLLHTPVDVIPGVGDKADTLFKGCFLLEGVENKLNNKEPWLAQKMPHHWHRELHRFNWVRDFSANGSDAAKRHVRALLTNWVHSFEEYEPLIWDPDIIARRLVNWMQQSPFLLTSNDGDFNYKFLRSLRKQLQHLQRYCRYFAREKDQFLFYLALYLGNVCFTDTQPQAHRLLQKLMAEIEKVILSDGCHVSRNPSQLLETLADLISLRETLNRMEAPIPEGLEQAIDRATTAVRFFQHGDGDLALFNGSKLMGEGTCDQLLAISNILGRSPHSMKEGGFERLKAGRSLILFETGLAGRPQNALPYHGAGSFEFSYGRDRIIVNCGAHPDPESPWHKALAATAAHSTLSVGDANAVFPAPVKEGAEGPIQVSVEEEGGSLLLVYRNPCFEQSAKIRHLRRIYLSSDGREIRGEDTVETLDPAADTTDFAVRFHIHPDISISKSLGGRSLLMMTRQGTGWQFLTSLSEAGLEESIYCSRPGEKRHNKQIVLRGRLHGAETLTIKWALHQKSDSTSDSKG
ncbi:heparinase II/III family protein [Sneathiella limimaris]|uniref:heparinase II/III family protein n=1 Tax=Sneathiella limimaris TaxID=1964213 RepID=UPI00146F2D4D|nr:heparinase II/III family protein [Sneathiella limimaris]